jgi:hypothetical protein
MDMSINEARNQKMFRSMFNEKIIGKMMLNVIVVTDTFDQPIHHPNKTI